MSLSQVQIIRSLGEALAWFEKELAWNVEPAELRHLSGRIGELYAAMITRGQMALATNQKGYDVVSAEGEHISVKTFTSSTHVTFRGSTFGEVDRVMILKINVDEGEASIQEVFDGSAEALKAQCNDKSGDYVFMTGKPTGRVRTYDELAVTARAESGPFAILQYENGTVVVERDGVREAVTKPILRQLAAEHGVSLVNQNGNVRNTRQLGAEVIAAVTAASGGKGESEEQRRRLAADRFAWGEGDVEMRDEDGQVITSRRAMELQLEAYRADVEEDPEDEKLS